MNLQDELATQILCFHLITGSLDVLDLPPASLDTVVPVSQQQAQRIFDPPDVSVGISPR